MEGFSCFDHDRQEAAFQAGLTDLAPPLIEDDAPLERPVRSESAPGIGQSPGADSDRAPARFVQHAAGLTTAATPHPGRGGSSRGDRGTAPAPGEATTSGGDTRWV